MRHGCWLWSPSGWLGCILLFSAGLLLGCAPTVPAPLGGVTATVLGETEVSGPEVGF